MPVWPGVIDMSSVKLITRNAVTSLVDPQKNKLLLLETEVAVTAGRQDSGHACINITFGGHNVYQISLDKESLDSLLNALTAIAREGEVLQ